VAPDKVDFRIEADSAIWETGSQSIPWDKIGLQNRPIIKVLQ
jgi:hypothetical protein